jgi:hypothetical protein
MINTAGQIGAIDCGNLDDAYDASHRKTSADETNKDSFEPDAANVHYELIVLVLQPDDLAHRRRDLDQCWQNAAHLDYYASCRLVSLRGEVRLGLLFAKASRCLLV